MSVQHMHAVSVSVRRECPIPLELSYTQLGTARWVLEIEPRSSAGVASSLNL